MNHQRMLSFAFAALVALTAPLQAKGLGRKETDTPPTAVSSLEIKMEQLSLGQRVAQLMVVTLQGPTMPDAQDSDFLSRYTPGGVVIPKILKPSVAVVYVEKLRASPDVARTGIPLLIGTDLYNLPNYGAARKEFFAQIPSLLTIAAADDPETTRRCAALMTDYLTTMGFNFHLGPSLVLAPSLPDAQGTVQCLGSKPAVTAAISRTLLNTFEEKGIIAMPMGFPGGGADRLGRDPAVLLTPKTLLAENDILPFRQAVDDGIGIIHVANTLVPTIDPAGRPASLSPAVMGDILRGELAFEGVIAAGPLDALAANRSTGGADAAVSALKAGADMLLWNQAGPRVMKAVDEVVAAVKQGQLGPAVIDAALGRVLRLKARYDLAHRQLQEVKTAEKSGKSKRYFEEAYQVERRAVTLVLNRDNTLPLRSPEAMPIGLTGVVGAKELHGALEKHIKPIVLQLMVTAKYTGHIQSFEFDRVTRRAEGLRTVVCILTNRQRVETQVELVRRLKEKGARVVVVLAGYPGALPDLMGADAILLAYCGDSAYAETMRAVADVLVGKAPLRVMQTRRDAYTRIGKTEAFSVRDLVQCPYGRLPVTLEPPFVAGLAVPYDPALAVKKAEWDFGDGKKAKGLTVNHAYRKPGRYPVMLTVTDGQREETSGTFYVVVE